MNEEILEKELLKKLVSVGYERVNITGIEEIEANLRVQLNRLNNIELTDEQFKTIKLELKKPKTIFDKAKFLRSSYFLERKNEHIKEIHFLDTADYHKNIFQVTNQIKVKGEYNNNRYDVTILINGLPLVHIELKRSTVDVTSAFHQIERYKKESMKDDTYFPYVQLFIISNEHTTYYINNNQKLEKRNLYDWKDEENNVIGNIFEFASFFLNKDFLSKYLSRYIILSEDEKNGKSILAMRSYQVQATEKILDKVREGKSGGYIWHTTGSGKTLTSFKAAEMVSLEENIEKVVFVVDRVDLDDQTVDEYNKFINKSKNQSSNSNGTVVKVKDTKHLGQLLENNVDKIIVTTMHKLDNLATKAKLNKKIKVVFIFDECHRSQLGDMHKNIDKYFDYPLKFGFTGTPIKSINRKDTFGELRTTSDVFGEQLHTYLINDAISDGNVLGFQVDYKSVLNLKNTLEYKDYEVEGIDTNEIFQSIDYISAVAQDIVDTFDRFTSNSQYNAMLATSGINSAIKYYKLLTGKEVDGVKLNISEEFALKKISCVYTISDNEKQALSGKNNRESLMDIVKDYNKMMGTQFGYNSLPEYKNDVSNKVKSKAIDLIIVSDMFLTGFDAKRLKTLYFDKRQKYHNLIQSISRTNRVYDEGKDFGQVVFYHPAMKKAMDAALELFSDPTSNQQVLKEPYNDLLKKTVETINFLKVTYPEIDVVNNLHQGSEEKQYLLAYRNVLRCKNAIETYREFNISDLPLSLYELAKYEAKYKEIYQRVKPRIHKESVLDDFDFEIQLIKSDRIDYDYIKSLISVLDKSESPEEEALKILKRFEFDPILKSKFNLIKQFFDGYYNTESDVSVGTQFDNFKEVKILQKIMNFSNKHELDHNMLIKLNKEYQYSNNYETVYEIEKEVVKSVNMFSRTDVKLEVQNFIVNEINNKVISIDDLLDI